MPPALADVERWFISRGVPHFIDGYSARADVFTRAAPALVLVLLAELLGAVNLEWPLWANLGALPLALAALLAVWGLVNRMRGRRFGQRPDDLGPVEVASFVLVPSLLPLVFGGQTTSAAVTAAANLALLGVIYVVTSYGLVPMTRWAAQRLTRQGTSILGLFVRALPLLLLFGMALLLAAEVWQMAHDLNGPFLWATLGLFAALGTLFLAMRLPDEVKLLAATAPEDAAQRLEGTPAAGWPPGDPGVAPALSRRQWANLGLVLLFRQGLQVVLVSLLMGLFCVAFTLLVVPPETVAAWSQHPVDDALATFALWGRDVVLTPEHVRVSSFLAAFASLYFSVTATTDATYRQEFFDAVTADVRQMLAVRAAYQAALVTGREPARTAAPPPPERNPEAAAGG